MPSTTINTVYRKALRVAASTVGGAPLIPTPNRLAIGSSTSGGTNQLIDNTKNFNTLGVKAGDVVINTQNGAVCYVLSVVNSTTLSIGANNFSVGSIGYEIYSQSDSGTVSAYSGGVVLWNVTTTSKAVAVLNLDGVTMNINIPAGAICPMMVADVTTNSGWGDIVALWS